MKMVVELGHIVLKTCCNYETLMTFGWFVNYHCITAITWRLGELSSNFSGDGAL